MPKYPRRISAERRKDGYHSYPLMVSGTTWFYEEPKGLSLAHEFHDEKSGVFIKYDLISLPWPSLCEAVDNHRRVKRKSARAKATGRPGHG